MKTICKNIAFSPSGNCIMEADCICKKKELWLAEDEPTEPDPYITWLDEEIQYSEAAYLYVPESNRVYHGQKIEIFKIAKEKYISLHTK